MAFILKQFTVINDNGKIDDPKIKKTFEIQFKSAVRDILNWVKLKSQCGIEDNSLNILKITEEFNSKVSLNFIKLENLK